MAEPTREARKSKEGEKQIHTKVSSVILVLTTSSRVLTTSPQVLTTSSLVLTTSSLVLTTSSQVLTTLSLVLTTSSQVLTTSSLLGDSIGQSGGCFEATTVPEQPRTFSSFPVPINSGILLKVREHAYNAFTRSVLLYASETWTVQA